MLDERTEFYGHSLAVLIRAETISRENQTDKSEFNAFHELQRNVFPKPFE